LAGGRSFTEYVKNTFDNQLWIVAEDYLRENYDTLDIRLYKIHKAGIPEIINVHVEHVWVEDLPEMKIQFDVAVSLCVRIVVR
jgi:hypothetical protein